LATRRSSRRTSLTGTIGDVRRRLRYLEGRPSPSKLANQVVRRTNIQPRAVATDQIALRAITNSLIDENAIAQAQIQDNSVGQDELQEDSVGNEELQDNSVDSPNIRQDAVGNEELDIDAVDSENILTDAVGNDELDIDAVTNENVSNDAIGNNELQNDSVDSGEIIFDAVGSDEIALDAVGSSEISLDAVGNSELAGNAVSGENIQDGAVEDRHIAGVAGTKITSEVPLERIPNLPASRTTSGTFNVNRIPDLSASKITSGTFGSDRIGTGAITEAKIGLDAVTQNKIKNEAVTFGKIAGPTACGLIVNSGITGSAGYIDTVFNSRSGKTNVVANVGTTSGTLAVGNHSHGGSSSVKVKKDISNYNIDPQNVLNLQLKKFKYKNSNRDVHEGFNREWLHGYLVEDVVEAGLEEVITYDHHGEPNGVRYDLIGVMSIELLKQQQNEIESLKEEIKRLKDSL
jgi:hypothetical protein